MTRVEHSSRKTGGSDNWQSPEALLGLVRTRGPIITDPCTTYLNPVGAMVYYTPAENGLSKPYYGFTYQNPPYSKAALWMIKAAEQSRYRDVEVLSLIAARTGANWFRPNYEYPLALWHGRLKFKGALHPAPFDSALVYNGTGTDWFVETFRKVSTITLPRKGTSEVLECQ